uniref:Uncharacterized protein n=1 Tax=Periophthalmus magnuspinnatus TaxID=409849 RepID=A0A3B4AI83_9GOBI
MAQSLEELHFNDVISRFQSKEFFQSDWDIASFAVFFIFIGESVCGHPVCGHPVCGHPPRRHKVGIDNYALEP